MQDAYLIPQELHISWMQDWELLPRGAGAGVQTTTVQDSLSSKLWPDSFLCLHLVLSPLIIMPGLLVMLTSINREG